MYMFYGKIYNRYAQFYNIKVNIYGNLHSGQKKKISEHCQDPRSPLGVPLQSSPSLLSETTWLWNNLFHVFLFSLLPTYAFLKNIVDFCLYLNLWIASYGFWLSMSYFVQLQDCEIHPYCCVQLFDREGRTCHIVNRISEW